MDEQFADMASSSAARSLREYFEGHVLGDPELENRALVVRLPANRTHGYRELRVRTRGHGEHIIFRLVPVNSACLTFLGPA